MTIGPKIRAMRKERGYTLQKLADKINVSSPFLSNVERGLKKPSILTLKRISLVLNTSVSYLLESPQENALGNKLKQLRESRGLSVEELSEICELSPDDIISMEEGRAVPGIGSLEKVANALNYSVRYFLENSGASTTIGSRLNALRRQKNLSLLALASKAGVSPSLLSQIENDRTVPLLDTLEKIARCLGVDSSYFLLDQEDGESLFFSLGPDVRELLLQPKVQAVMRSIRDFDKDELDYVLDFIHSYKKRPKQRIEGGY